MNIFQIIESRRSIRKFHKDKAIDIKHLLDMTYLASLAPNRLNNQPLEYIVVNNPKKRDYLFSSIFWGAKNPKNKVFSDFTFWPNAYIVILLNKNIRNFGFEYEIWASAENIMLYANSLWIWSVWLHSIDRSKIREILRINTDNIEINSMIGLWYPAHKSKIVPLVDDTQFDLDKDDNIYIPKRNLKNIISINNYGDKYY